MNERGVPQLSVAGSIKFSAPRTKFSIDLAIRDPDAGTAIDLLAGASGLSKSRLKDVMHKGAVWIRQGTRRPQRLRRVTHKPAPGDHLELHYDSAVIDYIAPRAVLIAEQRYFSVWNKPAGLLVEGSRYGDHATLTRQVDAHFAERRQVFLVHRLDLEASGLIVVAHTKTAAAKLSQLFSARQVHKEYLINVYGALAAPGVKDQITTPLDGKSAITEFEVLAHHTAPTRTRIRVTMLTGRYHQIRQHFASLGHAVVGDPKYGTRRAEDKTMQLTATRLSFVDPWSDRTLDYVVVPPWTGD